MKKTKKEFEEKVEILLDAFIKEWIPRYYGHLIDTDGNDGEGLRRAILEAHNQALQQQREDILTDLYGIRANIPLTTGMASRKQMKELIKKLEKIK